MRRCRLTIAILCWIFASAVFGTDKTSFNLGYFNGLALNGYDVMSYWRGGIPMKGSDSFKLEYAGATWIFSSSQNLEAFVAEPEKYAPQYGGFCAYAAAQGQLSDVDPFAWRIWKGRLYLNYSPRVRRIWANEIDANIEKGNQNWPGLNPANNP
ncbi:MAG: YHS domain-containing (seleno)protein [Pseudomonadota bacterium]